jgi:hypothetical protein
MRIKIEVWVDVDLDDYAMTYGLATDPHRRTAADDALDHLPRVVKDAAESGVAALANGARVTRVVGPDNKEV